MKRAHAARSCAWLAGFWLALSVSQSQAQTYDQSRPVLFEFVQSVVVDHPALRAAEAELQSARALGRGQALPLYNPELEIGYENAETETKDIGLSQTIDWSGKRGARSGVAMARVEAAEAAVEIARKALLTELMMALADYQERREAFRLAEHRVLLSMGFLTLAERRNLAGDLPQTDLLTARLTLAEARAQKNRTRADLSRAEQRLIAVVGERRQLWPALEGVPPEIPPSIDGARLEALPELRLALAETQASRSRIRVARKNRLPDPTFGLRGGREESDTLIGLRLSVPLPVRNSFRAEVEAAGADLTASEQSYEYLYRKAKARLGESHQRYRAVFDAWRDWRDQGAEPLAKQRALLQRLWKAGEINAIDYLVQLNQTFATESASVELHGRLWTAWFLWLDASGAVDEWVEGSR